ncbi:MAG: ribbon-helix-helix domain-containing protein [Kiritimatiellae bacterium]|jgi:predicted transcriptional regulator|nr:ribbon-helix-helix domain-containing protein [Kiritimatiellia bacterium]
MVRTQIYLTEHEKKALSTLASSSGKKQSELIREAIDNFIVKFSVKKREDIFDKLSGIWSDRDDSLTAESLRADWDRKW